MRKGDERREGKTGYMYICKCKRRRWRERREKREERRGGGTGNSWDNMDRRKNGETEQPSTQNSYR